MCMRCMSMFNCSKAGFSSQNADSAWGICYKRAALCCALLWAKRLNAKDIHREMFPVNGVKCLSCKTIHYWVEKFSQGRSKVADDARPGAEVAETTAKRLLCCGFRSTDKRMVQVYQRMICREINGFSRLEYHMFYVLYPFVTYLLTLPRISIGPRTLPFKSSPIHQSSYHPTLYSLDTDSGVK
jgi:hypothetical protein